MDVNTTHGLWSYNFLKVNAAKFSEEMYDWDDARVKQYIKDNSRNNFVLIEFTYKQLGRSEEWFQTQCIELNYDLFKIKREILLEWNRASDLCPFTEEEIQKMNEYVLEPDFKIYLKNTYPVEFYKDIDFSKPYFMSIDVAGGMEQDSSTIILSDPDNNLEVVGAFHNNKIDTIELAELIYELAKKYILNGPIIIESNPIGKGVIDFLKKTDIEPRLYYEIKTTKAEKKVTDIRKHTTTTMTRQYGIYTDTKTRPLMMECLRGIVTENYEYVRCKGIIDEIAGLERGKNGKIQHGATTHDDLLMAYLLAHYVWNYGTNLNAFFIYKKRKMFDLKNNGDVSRYEKEDADSAEKEFINRFNSVAYYNKDTSVKYSGFSSQEIIESYMEEKIYKEQQDLIEREIRKNDSILSTLNSFYNNY